MDSSISPPPQGKPAKPFHSGSQALPSASSGNVLNDLCEISYHGVPPSSVDAAENKTEPGFFPGLLLKAEGRLRSATTSITNVFGTFTLPCLFLGGGILGVAAATASFKTRMRALNRISACPPSTALPAAERVKITSVSLNTSAEQSATAQGVHTPQPASWKASHASSVLASELSKRRENSWDFDEEDNEKFTDGQKPPSAADLFTSKELAMLFLLPAATIISVLGGSWLIFKYQCGIPNFEHFVLVVKWLAGNGEFPRTKTPANSSCTSANRK